MQHIQWFRAYVEQLLAKVWEQPGLAPDADGDYPFRYGTAACYVRIEAGPPMTLRVVAQAAVDVRSSAKLLAELNDFNAHAWAVTAYWAENCVVLDHALLAEAVSHETLTRACADVGQAAHDIGVLVAGVFDGRTPFRPVAHADEGSS